ncbi:hypothetical protein EGW08_007077 [Elysia chlorotica]|uniref:rRNA adenine N(6)-methyltransferase n=1 Tax=Elysia chlorotica TaxID=188477 RepID=A0A3S1BCN4_ELYCH|nr:hypothetical protein EGW08_007077 [Elysia chlorotica]
MIRLPPLPTIQEIIRIYGLSARKKLSQNFLLDLNLTRKIIKTAGNLKDCCVVEVGPGPGGLTRSILNTEVEKLIVIEKDGRFVPSLEILSDASHGRMKIIQGDILGFDMSDVVPPEYTCQWQDNTPNIHVIGNLPFSVSTPLIIRWLNSISTQSNLWSRGRAAMTLTFQKEVAERIIAPPRSEYRCRLSVMCQYLCNVSLKFSIPGKAFVPPPKVDVGVVKFVPRREPLIRQSFALVERMNRHLFHHPNKFCFKSLGTLFPPDREDLIWTMVELSGVDAQIRPFELTNEQVGQLCNAYATIIGQEPDILTYEFRSQKSAKERRQKVTKVLALEQRLLSSSFPNENIDSEKDQR